MKPFNFLLQFILLVIGYTVAAQTFSNTTVSAYNTWNSSNAFGNFTKSIVVNGLPTPLGNTTGKVVLRQINVQLGTAIGTKCDLSTYNFRLTSPTGTVLDFISANLTTSTTSMWVNLHFRDDASLERIRDFSSAMQSQYFPFSIGYYGVETPNSFQSIFNGTNSNGNWIFSIKENASNEISFERVDLVFGPPFVSNNATGSQANNNCAGSVCFDNSGVTVGTNNGYPGSDPFYPGNIVNGCDWNGGNNNSAWFDFKPTGTTATVTISGMYSPNLGVNDIQPIIVKAPANCGIPTIVPTGGCPNDTSKNNKSYQTNYGGGVAPGNAYSNGITANAEFNLSGLTPNAKYYLYIDGNQGNTSSFYIESIGGLVICPNPLPVDWLAIKADCKGSFNQLKWQLGSEIKNDYFTVERSTDAFNYDPVGTIKGAGTVNVPTSYSFDDYNIKPDAEAVYYYRIKQVDYDGDYNYSSIVSCSLKDMNEFNVFPSPFDDLLYFNCHGNSKLRFMCYDLTGQHLRTDFINQKNHIDYSALKAGTYILRVFDAATDSEIKTCKILKR